MHQIDKHLWLGDFSDTRNTLALATNGIRAVLNVARDLDYSLPIDNRIIDPGKAIWQHKIGLVDGPGNPDESFLAAVMLLKGFVESGRTCLIHCHQGRSRSPSVAASYLATKTNTSFDEALARIKLIRTLVDPEQGILDLARKLTPAIKV